MSLIHRLRVDFCYLLSLAFYFLFLLHLFFLFVSFFLPSFCQARKQEAAQERMSQYQEREREKMAALLQMAKQSKQEGALWQS